MTSKASKDGTSPPVSYHRGGSSNLLQYSSLAQHRVGGHNNLALESAQHHIGGRNNTVVYLAQHRVGGRITQQEIQHNTLLVDETRNPGSGQHRLSWTQQSNSWYAAMTYRRVRSGASSINSSSSSSTGNRNVTSVVASQR